MKTVVLGGELAVEWPLLVGGHSLGILTVDTITGRLSKGGVNNEQAG